MILVNMTADNFITKSDQPPTSAENFALMGLLQSWLWLDHNLCVAEQPNALVLKTSVG